MNTTTFNFLVHEYIRAAPDAHLSSSESHLLATLLSEEDQYDYNQLLNTSLTHHTLDILHQLSSLLHLSSSTTWTAIFLLKKLTLLQHHIDLLTIIACITLSAKYQHSAPHHIDYELVAQFSQINSIHLIHDAEMEVLDVLSYDISVTTPDHFFSYLSNLINNDQTLTKIIHQARSSLSTTSLSHHTLHLLSTYSSSVVSLAVLLTITTNTSNTFIMEQIKSILLHKKHPSNYLAQLLHCTAQLQSATSSSSL